MYTWDAKSNMTNRQLVLIINIAEGMFYDLGKNAMKLEIQLNK